MANGAGKAVAFVAAAVLTAAACGDDGNSGAGSQGSDPGQSAGDATGTPDGGSPGAPGADGDAAGSASLRRIESCDEVASVLGDHIAGFEEGSLGFNVEDGRFDCPWDREPDPAGEEIYAVAMSGVYTNTPDFADNAWEAAGLEILEDERVESFGGLLLLQDMSPMGRAVMIEAPGFSLQILTNGSDTSQLPIEEMTDLMLELIDR